MSFISLVRTCTLSQTKISNLHVVEIASGATFVYSKARWDGCNLPLA